MSGSDKIQVPREGWQPLGISGFPCPPGMVLVPEECYAVLVRHADFAIRARDYFHPRPDGMPSLAELLDGRATSLAAIELVPGAVLPEEPKPAPTCDTCSHFDRPLSICRHRSAPGFIIQTHTSETCEHHKPGQN